MTRITVPIVPLRSYVDGAWVDEMDDTRRTLHDPNTGAYRQSKLATRPVDVERALRAARALYDTQQLEELGLRARTELILAVADELERRQDEIALQDSINTGAPLTTTRIIASSLGDRTRGAVREAAELGESAELGEAGRRVVLLRRAIGPAVIVAPWNAPTFTTVGKVAAAILGGCPVLLKPSENAPNGCQLFSEILVHELERRGFPEASFQLIQGGSQVGSLLTEDDRIEALSFTGGLGAGRTVAVAAASNLNVMQMELGSNNPAIVRADADVQQTAIQIVQGMTRLNGQWCEAPGKVLVHKSIHDSLVEAIGVELDRLAVGDALDAKTQVGPMAFERHRQALLQAVSRLESLGGELIATQRMPDLDGWFLAPGMIVGTRPEDANEELFGPLITVHSVDSDEDALAHANAPGGGLDGFVFSTNTEAAVRLGSRIRAGEVRVNGTFMSDLAGHSRQTFWGTSGIGGHSPQYGVRFFVGDRVVGIDRTDLAL
ncbi:aldehyde dehydrogenase family protein [Leucobacter triazinivorans]|uniref:Aldehyde dehydrogenase n=1 Tax=Leucobacter triazinivorans TaxID=1784719 RepID=A0A4P6KDK9_9MICO|nr:aldehyde dehydrogenase [Leucobacter triazinivorans]QBE48253.1 aldehyde dehydrogenase [Leucobacter triazinivorans]